MITAEKYGPWALIAGGSEGIGASFAHKLADAGINLILLARRPGPLEELASELRAKTRVQVRTLPLDLARPDMLERIREVTDDIDVGLLIFNAGDYRIVPFLEQPLDLSLSWIRMICLGQTSLAHHFATKMAKLGRGGIIFLGSLTGNGGMANVATYGGSKAFTQIFGEALWTELKPHGIDVLVLIVGAADTPARRRSGFGNPMAVNQCDEVAQWGLDNLANGPVYVLPLIADMFKQMCSLPRREVVEWVGSKVPVPHRQ